MPTEVGTHDTFQWNRYFLDGSNAPRGCLCGALSWIPAFTGRTVAQTLRRDDGLKKLIPAFSPYRILLASFHAQQRA
jgi:hypothetical protein